MNLRQQAGGPVPMIIVGIILSVIGFGIASAARSTDPALSSSSDVDPVAVIAMIVGIVGAAITAAGVVFLGVYLGVSRALEERDADRG